MRGRQSIHDSVLVLGKARVWHPILEAIVLYRAGQEAPVAGVVVPGPQEVQARAVVGLPVELVRVRRGAEAMLRVAERIIIDNTLKLPAITPTIISLFLFKEQVEYAICERPIACNVCIFASWKS